MLGYLRAQPALHSCYCKKDITTLSENCDIAFRLYSKRNVASLVNNAVTSVIYWGKRPCLPHFSSIPNNLALSSLSRTPQPLTKLAHRPGVYRVRCLNAHKVCCHKAGIASRESRYCLDIYVRNGVGMPMLLSSRSALRLYTQCLQPPELPSKQV